MNCIQIDNKDQILQQTKLEAQQEKNVNRPKAMMSTPMDIPMANLNLDNTVFAFTKIMWLQSAKDIMQGITIDPTGKEVFEKFVKTTSLMYQTHFDFCCKFAQIASAQV